MKLLSFHIITLLFCFCSQVHWSGTDLGDIFAKWNKATLHSLHLASISSEDQQSKHYYQNRIDAFHAYIDIKDESEINQNSIRYNFLQLIESKLIKKAVAIIENNLSGERITIRNYVIYENKKGLIAVELYEYELEDWKHISTKTINQQHLQSFLEHHRVASGFNEDDVIITLFESGIVKSSEYYLFNTLSSNGVQKIISQTN